MQPELDTYTFYFACVIFEFCSIVVMAMVFYVHRDEPAVKYWFLSFLLYFVGLSLLILSESSAIIILRNALLIGGCATSYKAIMTFFDKPIANKAWLSVFALAMAGISYWTLVWPSLGMRNLIHSAISIPIYLLMAYYLFSAKGSRGELSIYRALGTIHTVTALGLAARIEPLLTISTLPVSSVNAGLAGPIGLLGTAIFTFINAFIYTLLITGRIKKRLAHQAHFDGLTKLRNRRGFFEKTKNLHGQCGVMVIDIDEFKNLNDTYGHTAGDHALKSFATVLKQHLRASDICARAGGEEFWIALPGNTLQESSVVAMRIKTGIAKNSINFADAVFGFTVSIGVTDLFIDKPDDLPLAIQEADKSLLEAKRKGRNQVVTPLTSGIDQAPPAELAYD